MKGLGEELRKARLAKKMRLRDIARKTKINIKFLKAVEDDDFEILPEPYIRAFIKAYAKEIGLDVEEVIKKYDSIKEEKPEPEKIEGKPPSATKTTREFKFSEHKVAATVMGVVIVAVIATIYIYIKYGSEIFGTKGKEVKEIPIQAVSSVVDTTTSIVAQVKQQLHKLDLVALEKTWVRISVDDENAEEYIFDKGNTKSWTAKDTFKLRIGRADGLELKLNGKSLGNLGLSSEVIDLVLSKEGIVRKRIIKVTKVTKDTTEFENVQ